MTAAFAQSARTLTQSNPQENGISSQRLARIDQTLNDYVAKGYIPGAVALIARHGKIVYEKSFGFSDLENKSPLKNDNIFRIASQTKAITSLAIMMLWEEGKFLLDEPISKYILEFKNPKVLVTFNEKDSSYTAEPAKNEITIRQLLTHSSGISYASIGPKEFSAIYAKAHVPSGIGIGNTSEVLDLVHAELDRVAADGLTPAELDNARGHIRGSMALGLSAFRRRLASSCSRPCSAFTLRCSSKDCPSRLVTIASRRRSSLNRDFAP